MYARYLQDPESVDRSWRLFFAGFDLSRAQYGEDAASPATLKEFKVLDLIHGYRTRDTSSPKRTPFGPDGPTCPPWIWGNST